MVTQALSEDLIERIRHYIANDMNSQFPDDTRSYVKIGPEDVNVIYFVRVLTNWKAFATTTRGEEVFYELVHDGLANTTAVSIYSKRFTQQAVI